MGDQAIGEIDDLLIEKVSGRVAYAVMSFGGFLGLAHSHYPIPWSALKYDTALGGYRMGITEGQLKDAPAFSDDSWTDRDGRPHVWTLPCTHLLGSVNKEGQPEEAVPMPFHAKAGAARDDDRGLR